MNTSAPSRTRIVTTALTMGLCTISCSDSLFDGEEFEIPDMPGRFILPPMAYSVLEGEPDARIEVQISGVVERQVSIEYVTRDDTAIAGVDYTEVSGTLRWEPGEEGAKVITVPILDNDSLEGDEAFAVEIIDVRGAGDDLDPVTVTIVDDESEPPMFHALTREGQLLTVVVGPDGCFAYAVDGAELTFGEPIQELQLIDDRLFAITTASVAHEIDPLKGAEMAPGLGSDDPDSTFEPGQLRAHVFEADGAFWRMDLPADLSPGTWESVELDGPHHAEWGAWNVTYPAESLRSAVAR